MTSFFNNTEDGIIILQNIGIHPKDCVVSKSWRQLSWTVSVIETWKFIFLMCLYHMFLITATFNCVWQTDIQICPCVRFMLCNLGSVVISSGFHGVLKFWQWSLGFKMDFTVIDNSEPVVC